MLPGELIRSGVNKLANEPADFGRGTGLLQDAIDQFIEPPETQGGKMAARVLAGGAGGAALVRAGIGTVGRNAVAGVASAGGSEAGAALGGQIGGDNGRIIGGVLGGLAGGVPMSIAKGQGNYQQMLAEAIKGLEPGDFASARRIALDAKMHGIDLTPEQLFDKSSGLDDLMTSLLRVGASDGKLQSRVMDTGKATQFTAQSKGNAIGPRVDLADANRDIRLAAEGAIVDAGTTSPAVGRLFREGEAVLAGPEIDRLDEALSALEASYRGSKETVAAIKDLRGRLSAVTEKRQVQTGTRATLEPGKGAQKWRQGSEPIVEDLTLGARAGDVDTVVKSVEAILKDIGVGTPAMERLLTGRVGGAVGQLKNSLDNIITTRPQGAELYRSMKERQEALTSSIVGRMAGRTGVNEALPDPKTVITGNLGGNYPQDKEVALLAGALKERAARAKAAGDDVAGAQASRALPQAARVKWDEAVNAAFDGGPRVGAGGAALADKLIGNNNPVKEANFRALMIGSREAMGGEDPKAFADGMVALLRAMRASSRNRAGVSVSGTQPDPRSLGSIASDASATSIVSPVWGVARGARGYADRLADIAHQRQYEKLVQIFNDPNALQLIEQLGKMPLGSSRSGAILSTLIGAAGTPTQPTEGTQNGTQQ